MVLFSFQSYSVLELRSGSYESLTSLVAFVLSEVLDEACSEVLSLLFPLASAVVSVAWVETIIMSGRASSARAPWRFWLAMLTEPVSGVKPVAPSRHAAYRRPPP